MDEEYMIFAEADGLYPGQVIRAGPPVDWSAILQGSILRHRRDSVKTKPPSHAAVSSTGAVSRDDNTRDGQTQPQEQVPQISQPESSDQHDETSPDPLGSTANVSLALTKSPTTKLPSPQTPSASVSEKLRALLAEPSVNVDALKNLSWAGLPAELRAPIWKILLGYAPSNRSRRMDTLGRKRREYRDAVEQHYAVAVAADESATRLDSPNMYGRGASQEDVTMRQIAVDIPRTCPEQMLFQISQVQVALQRVLYVWATRHPASGYVQGMNDLVTPFMSVFLSEYADEGMQEAVMDAKDLSMLGEDASTALGNAEADAYWCLTALLNDIQDYYTFSQPGIQRRVHFLRELVSRVDSGLCCHLEEEGVDFLQFAFRWMNCLLMRELPFRLIVRVWDTYLAEADGFAVFHVYVCAALLVSFSDQLMDMDFQDLVMFLQNLPTRHWSEKDIDVILSQAYMWRTIFGAAPSHLH